MSQPGGDPSREKSLTDTLDKCDGCSPESSNERVNMGCVTMKKVHFTMSPELHPENKEVDDTQQEKGHYSKSPDLDLEITDVTQEKSGDPSMQELPIDTWDKCDNCSPGTFRESFNMGSTTQKGHYSKSPDLDLEITDVTQEKSEYSNSQGLENTDQIVDQTAQDIGQDPSLPNSSTDVLNNKPGQKKKKTVGIKVGFYQDEEYEEGTEAYEDLKLLQRTFNLSDILSGDEARCLSRRKNHDGKTEIHLAAAKGDLSLLRALERVGGNVDGRDIDGWTPVMYAAIAGKVESVQLLYDAGADLEVMDMEGHTLLHLAVASANDQLVAWLLGLGFDVNQRDFHHLTPLHHAAGAGNTEVVRILIENGADIDAIDEQERTAFKFAQIAGYPKIIDLLHHESNK